MLKIILTLEVQKTIQYENWFLMLRRNYWFQFKCQGNPYVGQDKIGENKFIINSKNLNHRWIIADFSDGDI
jgi:hypothetical protein